MKDKLILSTLLFIIAIFASTQLTVEPISVVEYHATVNAINNTPIQDPEVFWLNMQTLVQIDKRLKQPGWVKLVRPNAVIVYSLLVVAFFNRKRFKKLLHRAYGYERSDII